MSKHEFLSVLTRTHKRPKAIRICLNSLNNQTVKNFSVIIISDNKEDNVENLILEYPNLSIIIHHVAPLGYPACNTYFNSVKNIVNSDYVIFLDDDDEVIDKNYFKILEHVYTEHKPSVIMSRTKLGNKLIIPSDNHWKKFPGMGCVSTLNFCTRYDIYMKHNWPNTKCGDFTFIDSVAKSINWQKDVYWHNEIMTAAKTYPGYGAEEK